MFAIHLTHFSIPVVEPFTTEGATPGSLLGEKEILIEHNSPAFVLFILEPVYVHLLSFHWLMKQSQQLNQLVFHSVGIYSWLRESWCYGGIL